MSKAFKKHKYLWRNFLSMKVTMWKKSLSNITSVFLEYSLKCLTGSICSLIQISIMNGENVVRKHDTFDIKTE